MKKQFFTFVLTLAIVAAMALTLAACGNDTPANNGGGATPGNNPPASTPTPKSNTKEDNKPPSDLKETPASDFEYKYDAETEGVMIQKYTGSTLRVRIPEKIEGEPVTSIGKEAFKDNGFKEVYLPNGLKTIGSEAFKGCNGVTGIVIPKGVTEIDGFNGCTGLTSLTIPNGVTKIWGMFDGCTGLTSITIPESVMEINGLNGCTGLTSVTIPESVIEISGFRDCTGLTNVTIPDSVKNVGYGNFTAFSNCNDIIFTYKGNTYTKRESLFHAITGQTWILLN